LRGNPEENPPWPVMGFIAIESSSEKVGSSRCNPGEAETIARWLKDQYGVILNYARRIDSKLQTKSDIAVFFKTVAIITPFSKQAILINKALKKIGLPAITVGTVHKLQGDERSIVLFSSVYGSNDSSSGKFYDRSSHMLNVAVSRAKNVFLVFGSDNNFGKSNTGNPSGILRKYLKDVEVCSAMRHQKF
jgi:hypothetical protein